MSKNFLQYFNKMMFCGAIFFIINMVFTTCGLVAFLLTVLGFTEVYADMPIVLNLVFG